MADMDRFGQRDIRTATVMRTDPETKERYFGKSVVPEARSIGIDMISHSDAMQGNKAEVMFPPTFPKTFLVTNRAKLGNVKVWFGAFNGQTYPEGATTLDNSTWLQPEESMQLSRDEVIGLFGMIFNDNIDIKDAVDIVEKYGGFELETKEQTAMYDVPRIVGGPLLLPDLLVQGIDGRARKVGVPISVYELYDGATRKLWRKRISHDLKHTEYEKHVLSERLREWREADGSIFSADGSVYEAPEYCDCSAIQHVAGVVGCEKSLDNARATIISAPQEKPPRSRQRESLEKVPAE